MLLIHWMEPVYIITGCAYSYWNNIHRFSPHVNISDINDGQRID